MEDLNAFQRDLLYVNESVGEASGLEIKDVLDSHYDEEIDTSRLYPNLDELVDRGLIDKGSIDGRTNSYTLSEEGHQALAARREWEESLKPTD
ncbi:PadR family transcriptional regulator [Halococcus saccharolyticus]|uniref:Transcription regulator PadR N-terminal domain-containing protein n=1 Tax=Halococcus saccharolyticus DSM 5350 TaxID=1227455 RepID=M0MKV2_9EURY|nr:PadR family transcriptional regulator [Halococcus saccharolyticus]EMA46301.1 hypothetical protein C449_04690 [Halococcus saccharolyticus DSM 5350]